MSENKNILIWDDGGSEEGYNFICSKLQDENMSYTRSKDIFSLQKGIIFNEIDALILFENDNSVLFDRILELVLKLNPWFPVIFIYKTFKPAGLHQMVSMGLFDAIDAECIETECVETFQALVAYLTNLYTFPPKFRQIFSPQGFGPLIGNSKAMQEIYQFIFRLMEHDITVSIYGQSGTGKEIVARLLHQNSARDTKKFVTINCAAVPESLLESELFGHEKGAFTGALNERVGKFGFAHEGSLFLDEIGEMSLPLQAKLLRIIEQGQFEKIGSNTTEKVNVRLITATNRDLKSELEKGTFREDLFFRINVFPLHLPPLNERHNDALLLSHRFINRFSNSYIKGISKSTLKKIKSAPWEGNVRQLENTLTHLAVLEDSDILDKEIITSLSTANNNNTEKLSEEKELPFKFDKLSDLERWQIDRIMAKSEGNISEAARRLGISRVALYRKLGKQEENEE
ncbi:MAG: sigma-54-dependent Fis family transcriptional regulator [Candidatus Marinimicrobia bacterium]|nr:sigma-54-dependent Fis family transcriptional regulator [Candidatus Neomarinimicrobiota bacterium]